MPSSPRITGKKEEKIEKEFNRIFPNVSRMKADGTIYCPCPRCGGKMFRDWNSPIIDTLPPQHSTLCEKCNLHMLQDEES